MDDSSDTEPEQMVEVHEAKPVVNRISIEYPEIAEKFRSLHQKIRDHDLMAKTKRAKGTSFNRLGLGSMRITLDEIQAEITNYNMSLSESESSTSSNSSIQPQPLNCLDEQTVSQTYMKIILRLSEDFLLYEQSAITVLRGTDEGSQIEEDNKRYDYLTVGEGKRRHRLDAVSQTMNHRYKTRAINTKTLGRQNVASYVSSFEMFDTYKALDQAANSFQTDGKRQIEETTYQPGDVDPFVAISASASFQLALMLMTRALAGNVYMQGQRRFRNMTMPNPLALDAQYHYRLDELWRFRLRLPSDEFLPAVSDMSWCHSNGDILAVAYGNYTCATSPITTPRRGHVCIWNIKNPVNPERYYRYPDASVTAVEFSPLVPQLLAIGLHDGSVEVRDITDPAFSLVAKAQRTNSLSFEPVMAFRWTDVEQQLNKSGKDCHFEASKMQDFLTLWRNGAITKYRIINSPYLHSCQQQLLDRVGDSIEGSAGNGAGAEIQAHRHVQGMNLAVHPLHADIFYVSTDDGCVHKCSTQYPQQHLEVFPAHRAAANSMDFSPACPKVFLTCGNDWCIHIWIDGIPEPLITLSNSMQPIHCAYWSKTHSTIIVAVSRKTVDIWDIRRNTLRPVSSHAIEDSYNTELKLSNCGRSIAVGNEDGNVTMLAFEDMPFPAHFQSNELKITLMALIADNSALKKHVEKRLAFKHFTDIKRKRRK